MRYLFFLLTGLLMGSFCYSQVKVQRLLSENQVDPISIDALIPRFSWQLDAGGRRDVMQTAYEIKVTSYLYLKKGKHEDWSSGKVTSGQSVYVPYGGEALVSGKKYYWQVRVWDNLGKAS